MFILLFVNQMTPSEDDEGDIFLTVPRKYRIICSVVYALLVFTLMGVGIYLIFTSDGLKNGCRELQCVPPIRVVEITEADYSGCLGVKIGSPRVAANVVVSIDGMDVLLWDEVRCISNGSNGTSTLHKPYPGEVCQSAISAAWPMLTLSELSSPPAAMDKLRLLSLKHMERSWNNAFQASFTCWKCQGKDHGLDSSCSSEVTFVVTPSEQALVPFIIGILLCAAAAGFSVFWVLRKGFTKSMAGKLHSAVMMLVVPQSDQTRRMSTYAGKGPEEKSPKLQKEDLKKEKMTEGMVPPAQSRGDVLDKHVNIQVISPLQGALKSPSSDLDQWGTPRKSLMNWQARRSQVSERTLKDISLKDGSRGGSFSAGSGSSGVTPPIGLPRAGTRGQLSSHYTHSAHSSADSSGNSSGGRRKKKRSRSSSQALSPETRSIDMKQPAPRRSVASSGSSARTPEQRPSPTGRGSTPNGRAIHVSPSPSSESHRKKNGTAKRPQSRK